jgi:sortase A
VMRSRIRRFWLPLLGLGIVLVGVGGLLIAGPVWSTLHRGQADQSALQSWNDGGSAALVGPVSGGSQDVAKGTCGSSSATDYALVTFEAPAQDHYAGVAGNGTWDLLSKRSMVHYAGTPDPGQQGNVIIAFHREPDYEHIDQMRPGDRITVQDRACHMFIYRVTGRWELHPSQVTQLTPTNGHDLTLITCDPWWQDYNRLVWRATLVSPAPQPNSASSSAVQPTNPTF